jgi:hypothetical protein
MNIQSLDSLKIQGVRVDYSPNERINYIPPPKPTPKKMFKYLTVPKELVNTSSNAKILGFNDSGTQPHGKIRHNINNSYLTLHFKSLEFRVRRKQHNGTVHLG